MMRIVQYKGPFQAGDNLYSPIINNSIKYLKVGIETIHQPPIESIKTETVKPVLEINVQGGRLHQFFINECDIFESNEELNAAGIEIHILKNMPPETIITITYGNKNG